MDFAEPLSEAELDQLEQFLGSIEGGRAMNIEAVDGFLSALIVGPELVMPSEYLPHVVGSDTGKPGLFKTEAEAEELLSALIRHWNTIARTLNEGELYYPLLLEDDDGVARGNDWALGFLRGVDMRRSSWREFLDDEDQGAAIFPMLALAHENDPDPQLRFESPTPEKRDELIRYMIVGLAKIHEYFRGVREAESGFAVEETFARSAPQVGRNDPCPCGSGKKYKKCCGARMH